jgi:hypothetical protein
MSLDRRKSKIKSSHHKSPCNKLTRLINGVYYRKLNTINNQIIFDFELILINEIF